MEVDPDTGVVEVVKYSAVDDFGRLINPMIVEGQVHGGIAHGWDRLCWKAAHMTAKVS